MAFWHVCQKANCITKSAFSAFSRLFPPFRLFSSSVNDGNGGGGDFVGDDGDTNLATEHDTTLGSGSVA